MLRSAFEYIATSPFDEVRERLHAGLPRKMSRRAEAYDPKHWYPIALVNELCAGIAAVHGASEAKTYGLLEGLGIFSAQKATSSSLKLLMRVLTPALYAKKAPEFWAREYRIGKLEADLSAVDAKKLVFHLREIAPLVHVAPIAAGFTKFALGRVGLAAVEVTTHGWSVAEPSPSSVRLDVHWA